MTSINEMKSRSYVDVVALTGLKGSTLKMAGKARLVAGDQRSAGTSYG